MSYETLITFIFTAVLLTLAPGPDILFVTAKSIAEGTRAGVTVACGLITGTFAHTALAALGISLLIKQSETAFFCIKWGGVMYLIYLGVQAFRHRGDKFASGDPAENKPKKSSPTLKLYFTGVCMAVMNPKLILFFLAFLPQFVPAGTTNAGEKMLLLGAIFAAQALVIFSIVAAFAGTISNTLREKPSASKWLNIITAIVLFGIAATVAIA